MPTMTASASGRPIELPRLSIQGSASQKDRPAQASAIATTANSLM